jgi:hypothetical protein
VLIASSDTPPGCPRRQWDLKQIFNMALAEEQLDRNPALLLFTPNEAKKPVRRAMTIQEVQNECSLLSMSGNG